MGGESVFADRLAGPFRTCIRSRSYHWVEALRKSLGQIAPGLADIEVEEVVLYGDVEERLRETNISCGTAHTPATIPPEQI